MTHPVARAVATWFGSGKSPVAPGTAGSLAALPFAWAVQTSGGALGMAFATLGLLMIGVWATALYMRRTGQRDPKEVVIDEVAGIFLILTPLPATWQAYLLGFTLFRFFDIVKPWPISWVDRRFDSAAGVMADDVLAALYPYFLLVAAAAVGGMLGYPLEMEWAFGWMFAS